MGTYPVQALIFDFDGLMVDTESPALQSWRLIYADYGQSLDMQQWERGVGSAEGFDPLAHLATLMAQHRPDYPFDLATVREQHAIVKARLNAGLPLLPGVLDMLNAAATLRLPCAVASSSNNGWVQGWLAHFKLLDRFRCIRTADDVALTKPAPDLFLAAAACLRTAPAACVVFEDSPNGIRAARAAGMRCVAVPNAVTRHLTLPPATLTLEGLHTTPLADLLVRLETIPPPAPPQAERGLAI